MNGAAANQDGIQSERTAQSTSTVETALIINTVVRRLRSSPMGPTSGYGDETPTSVCGFNGTVLNTVNRDGFIHLIYRRAQIGIAEPSNG
jgi:hypothetical protein